MPGTHERVRASSAVEWQTRRVRRGDTGKAFMSAVGRRQPRPCRHIARCHGIRADHSSMRNGWREAQPGRLDVDQSVGPVFYFATFLWWGQHLHEMARMSSSLQIAPAMAHQCKRETTMDASSV